MSGFEAKKQKQFNDTPKKLNNNELNSYLKLGNNVPPHSIDAEISVLGSMMLNHRQAIAKVVEIIDENAFYSDIHKVIYEVLCQMFDKGTPVDLITLTEELKRKGKLEYVGGEYYLTEINLKTPSAANIESHALIVLEKYLKRQLIETSGQILVNAYDDTNDVLDEIDRAEAAIFKLAEKRFSKSYRKIDELVHEAYDIIQKLSSRDHSQPSGVPSGIKKLDEMLGGFQNSDLIIIAARPSMGKTALGLSIASNAALHYNVPLAFFSIEMAASQIVVRLLSGEAKINQQNIRTGQLNQNDHHKIVQALGRLQDAPIVIDDSPMLNILELRAKCRRLKAEHNIKLVIVDYLQLLHAPKAESREREISIISSTLKQIAKELEIPVVALAQLNRSVDSRTDKRPMLSDLRESGSIEQDADVVMFVNRPEVYKLEEFSDGQTTEGKGELIVGKQRNGPTGTVRVAFQKDYARFENLIEGFEEPPKNIQNDYNKHIQNSDIPNVEYSGSGYGGGDDVPKF